MESIKTRSTFCLKERKILVFFGFGNVLFIALWRCFYRNTGFVYIALSLLFTLVVVLVTMKVKIGNPILAFLGKHLFRIYILQRIPFMVLKDAGLNTYLFFALSLITTMMIAVLYDMLFNTGRRALMSLLIRGGKNNGKDN